MMEEHNLPLNLFLHMQTSKGKPTNMRVITRIGNVFVLDLLSVFKVGTYEVCNNSRWATLGEQN